MSAFLKGDSPSRSKAYSVGIKAVAATASVLLLASCASGSGEAEPSETSEPAAAAREADGVLTVGAILPQTGDLQSLGPPEFAGVDLAVAEIGESDFEFEVETIIRDSGDSQTDIATQAATELVGLATDVVVGAASSGVSLTFIDQLVSAGVVQISPANTSPEFSTYEDEGWYWRTAPSDVLQGRVLGNTIVGDGAANVGIIYINDPYGTGLTDNATLAIEEAGGTVTAAEPFNPSDTNFANIVTTVIDSGAEAIIVIAFAQTTSIVPELITTQGFPQTGVYFVDGNLNSDYDFPPGTLEGVKGTQPGNIATEEFQARLDEVNPDLRDNYNYGAESYDAVILSALAATQGGSDDPTTIRDNLQSVSEGGEKCTVFADCLALLADETDIDYDGPSGPITFDENGDPTEAYIGIYQYDAQNGLEPLNAEFGSLAE